MAYVPLNVNVYSAAFAGAMAGLGVPGGAFIVDPTTGDYATIATVSANYAQAVDTAWGAARVANNYDLSAISVASSNIFTRHPGYPLTGSVLLQTNWTVVALALVAMVQQGDTNASAPQNITLPGAGSGSNRAYSNPSTGVQIPGQATITVIAAMKLIAKGSGLFKAWYNLGWDQLAAADVATVTVKVFTDAVAGTPLTLGNFGFSGFGSNGFAQPGNVAVNNNGTFGSTAGAGITIAGANAGYTEDVKTITVGTAAAGGVFAWEGIVGVATYDGNEHPFTIGKTCLITISLTNSVAARNIGTICMGMYEL